MSTLAKAITGNSDSFKNLVNKLKSYVAPAAIFALALTGSDYFLSTQKTAEIGFNVINDVKVIQDFKVVSGRMFEQTLDMCLGKIDSGLLFNSPMQKYCDETRAVRGNIQAAFDAQKTTPIEDRDGLSNARREDLKAAFLEQIIAAGQLQASFDRNFPNGVDVSVNDRILVKITRAEDMHKPIVSLAQSKQQSLLSGFLSAQEQRLAALGDKVSQVTAPMRAEIALIKSRLSEGGQPTQNWNRELLRDALSTKFSEAHFAAGSVLAREDTAQRSLARNFLGLDNLDGRVVVRFSSAPSKI